jgi:uncharacterized membrane protein
MKQADIDRIFTAGLITEDQRQKIIEHFNLHAESNNRFLAIISTIGGLLIVSGIILLISANWESIPRWIKIVCGLLLMLGAHGAGWWLREMPGKYPRTGEVLHLVGSGLFLANIALVGQIYHLSAREPNGVLFWWLGIVWLPWLLRSVAQHVLFLLAFGTWFGMEVLSRDGWLFAQHHEEHFMLYMASLGLIYAGAGLWLRFSRYSTFAGATEKLGFLAFAVFTYPFTWGWHGHTPNSGLAAWSLAAMGALSALALGTAAFRDQRLTPQWRAVWASALLVASAFPVAVFCIGPWPGYSGSWLPHFGSVLYMVAAPALFLFYLLQIQVGIQQRSAFLVNLAVAMIALILIAVYIKLLGSMAATGLMFLVSGVFLIGLGIYLEKKRRRFMTQIRSKTPLNP